MKAGTTTLGRRRGIAAMALASAVLMGLAPASRAQLGDVLKNPMGGGAGGTAESAAGALGGMGGLSLQSFSSGSMGNVAGLLDFCIKNNYLGAGGAASVKDKLMDKLGGPSKASADSGYGSGTRGILQDSHGKTLDLSGSGLKAKATEQVCEKVLAQGKSFL